MRRGLPSGFGVGRAILNSAEAALAKLGNEDRAATRPRTGQALRRPLCRADLMRGQDRRTKEPVLPPALSSFRPCI